MPEKYYNVDLIDNNDFSYRLFQQYEVYNDDIKYFAKKVSEIINIPIKDRNNVEGYKNIFIKNKI